MGSEIYNIPCISYLKVIFCQQSYELYFLLSIDQYYYVIYPLFCSSIIGLCILLLYKTYFSEPELAAATKEVAKSLGGDVEATESELLSTLKSHALDTSASEKPSANLR